MSEKRNDIIELAYRSNILAHLAGRKPLTGPGVTDKPLRDLLPSSSSSETELMPSTAAGVIQAATGRDVLGSYIASRVSPQTKRTMRAALDRIARLLGSTVDLVPWHELRFEHTDAIRAKLLDGTYSKATVEVTLAALKGVLRQARRMRLLSQDDFATAVDWDPLKLKSLPTGRELTQEEIDKIQAHIASFGGAYGAFLEVVFALLLGTGLRATEACRMPIAAYDRAARTIRLMRKGDKEDELPLGDPEVKALDEWLEHRRAFAGRIPSPALLLRVQANDWVRPSSPECDEQKLKHLCTQISAALELEHFTPHDLRRTFCTRAIRESGDDFAVQALMGHAKIETTRKYDKRKLEEHAGKRRTWNIWRPPPAPAATQLKLATCSIGSIIGLAPLYVAQTIEGWIASGDVRIEEIDLALYAKHSRLRTYQSQARQADGGNAGENHQILCALSALFIEASGRPFTFDRARCWYAGGLADVCALDASIYVECGCIQTPERPLRSLENEQALMIVPYPAEGTKPMGYIFRALTDTPKKEAYARLAAARR